MKKIRTKVLCVLLGIVCVLSVVGCKKKAVDANEYATKADEFYERITAIGAEIDALNTKTDDADRQLLVKLDALNDEVKAFAELDPPENLKDAKERAVSASNFMSEAVSLFHKAFESESVDQTALDEARYNYGNAIIEIKNIGIALQNAG